MKGEYEKGQKSYDWHGSSSESLLIESMERGSVDNVSLILIGLNDPSVTR